MISLDQVLLLEKKVESAVQRIAQLNTENAALRTKCVELTNALSEKTEQLSAFENDQAKIEEGILKALDRLNSVENSVLKAAGFVHADNQSSSRQEDAPVPLNHQEEKIQSEAPLFTDSQERQHDQSSVDSTQKTGDTSRNGQFDIF